MSGDRPLRWMLMASHVPPGGSLGGIVRYTVELARALGRREDVELHLSVGRDAAADLRPLVRDDAHLHPLPRALGPVLPLVERYALGPALGSRYDVVQGVKHLLPAGVRALTVLTVHDMILTDRPQDFGRAKRTLLQRPYLASLRQADVPLCVSAATRERLRAHVPAAAARAAVTPLASSPTLLEAVPEPVPALVGRPFGLVVGDPSPRKNVPLVLEAWSRVVRERPDAVLVLVGPPSWGASRYGAQLDALEASGNLVRLQSVPDRVLSWCYRHAAVVMCPSLVEGFGLPVVEALDLGARPVISSDPAQVEAADGRAAAVLPADAPQAWADAVLGLLDAPRQESPVQRRTWDDVAAETVAAVTGSPEAVSSR